MDWNSRIVNDLVWEKDISNLEAKQKIGQEIAKKVKSGQTIGFGSGSTSLLAIQAIGERVRQESMEIQAVTTSHEMQLLCQKLRIPTVSFLEARPDWGFDGADEVDPQKSLIKGRGGAMFREKLVIATSKITYILVDQTKFVKKLGENFAVPVEVVPLAMNLVENRLLSMGATEIELRQATRKDGPVITENGNLILDVKFDEITLQHEKEISYIPGVLDSGLFIGYNVETITT